MTGLFHIKPSTLGFVNRAIVKTFFSLVSHTCALPITSQNVVVPITNCDPFIMSKIGGVPL